MVTEQTMAKSKEGSKKKLRVQFTSHNIQRAQGLIPANPGSGDEGRRSDCVKKQLDPKVPS